MTSDLTHTVTPFTGGIKCAYTVLGGEITAERLQAVLLYTPIEQPTWEMVVDPVLTGQSCKYHIYS